MKCISLVAETHFSTSPVGAAVCITRQRYPNPEFGILVHMDSRRIQLAKGTVVQVDEDFFRPGMPADHAVWIGRQIKILRASLQYNNESGNFELTRETDPEDKRVIVYLDVGNGDGDQVTYEASPLSIVARGSVSYFPYQSAEEVALGLLSPDETITAVRSRRRWVFWGERNVRETITYRLVDGNVSRFVCRP